jgi:AcrR family transcriptional regulator
MAPPIRTPRGEWIRQGLRALAEGGPGAVRIEPLARALGVTRGGFYWHFEDRQALLDGMLDTWERATTEKVAEHLDSEGGDAADKLRRLFALTSPAVVRTDLAIRDWARHDPAIAERLRRIDNRRMCQLRALFGALGAGPAEAEARSLLAFSLLIGNHYIAADHGPRSRADVIGLALGQLGAGSLASSRPASGKARRGGRTPVILGMAGPGAPREGPRIRRQSPCPSSTHPRH